VKVTRFYTGPDNRTHFEDLDIPTAAGRGAGSRSEPFEVTGMLVRESEGDAHFLELHPAPRRQLILCLSGVVEIEAGDGTKRRFGPGDIYLADDLKGEGHRHREIEGPVKHAWVFLSAEMDLGAWGGTSP
jgi:quercetin dioxygenase-like cupin family protein